MVFSSLLTRSVRPCTRLLAKRTIITSKRPDFEPQNALLQDYLTPFLEKNAERTAILDHVAGTSLTHGEVKDMIGRVANYMIDSGLKPGDHVGLASFNHLHYFPLMLGIIAAGGKPALCNPGYIEREMEGLFVTGAAQFGISHFKNSEVIQSVCNKLHLPPPLDVETIIKKSMSYSTAIPRIPGIGIHDTACLFYSSGTTGFPKAVETTHDNFVSQLMLLGGPDCSDFNETSVNNGFLPSYHCFGSVIGMLVLSRGAQSVCLDGFVPDAFLEANQKHKITFATLVPPVMVFLAKHPLVDNYDLTSLTDILCAAAPLSEQLEKDVLARLNNPKLNIRQGYGLSETSAACHYVAKGMAKAGSIGGVGPSHICKLVNVETREEVAQGESGEILIKGPCVMKGYLNNPKATEETFTEDGWLLTGDIGYIDEEEDFYIIDRLKEFIKVKGFQVAPAELEALLLEHPLIADAAVIGIPDERAGERPKAFVVKAAGVELSDADVKKFVADNVTDYKVPSQVEFIEIIPKLPSGKIQRKELRLIEKAAREAAGL